MDKADYLKGIWELYGAEIEGEAMATRWLELATDPEQQYKLGLFLQLEPRRRSDCVLYSRVTALAS
jgi:hypothetical protein